MQSGYELLLSEGLLDYFEVIHADKLSKVIIIHLDERVLSSLEDKASQYLSKGFYPTADIHDFPLRGKSLTLCVRRRCRQNKDTGASFMRNWDLGAQGTRLTAKFAAFLKALS